MKPIYIPTEKIPEIELILLSASVPDGVMEHFNNPENQRCFKERQEKRKTMNEYKITFRRENGELSSDRFTAATEAQAKRNFSKIAP